MIRDLVQAVAKNNLKVKNLETSSRKTNLCARQTENNAPKTMQSSASSHLSSTSGTGKVKSEIPESEELSVPPIRTLPRQMEQKETRPNVDYQDKLWSQIDVLDDVRRMAREQDTYEGFPPAFESELHKLRETHVTLLQTMKRRRDEQNEDRGTIDNNEEERKLVNDLMNSLEGLKDWHG